MALEVAAAEQRLDHVLRTGGPKRVDQVEPGLELAGLVEDRRHARIGPDRAPPILAAGTQQRREQKDGDDARRPVIRSRGRRRPW